MLQDRQARRELARYTMPIVIAPESALLVMVHEAAGNVAYLGARVDALLEADEASGAVPEADTARGTRGSYQRASVRYEKGRALFGPKIELDRNGSEHIVGEELRGMVKLYNEERDRLANYSKAAIAAGLMKAQVEVAQQQGALLVLIVNRVLNRIGLAEDQLLLAREMLATEFRQQAQVELLEAKATG